MISWSPLSTITITRGGGKHDKWTMGGNWDQNRGLFFFPINVVQGVRWMILEHVLKVGENEHCDFWGYQCFWGWIRLFEKCPSQWLLFASFKLIERLLKTNNNPTDMYLINEERAWESFRLKPRQSRKNQSHWDLFIQMLDKSAYNWHLHDPTILPCQKINQFVEINMKIVQHWMRSRIDDNRWYQLL